MALTLLPVEHIRAACKMDELTKKRKYKEIKALLERASELLDQAYTAHLAKRKLLA